MDCFNPLTLPVYVQKDGKKIQTKSYREVPCGKCPACRERLQQGWIFRLTEELKHSRSAYFVTYTYSDENPPYIERNGRLVMSVKKRDMQLYLKRLRKRLPVRSLRYYIASEYGSKTLRPHYHAILFYYGNEDLREILQLDWPHGFICVGSVTINSIAYTTKYVLKGCETPPDADPPFVLSSRNPAIGLCYVNDATREYHDSHEFVNINDRKLAMPRYYRNKFFDQHESSTARHVDHMEQVFFKEHPQANYVDFYLWRESRQKAYIENKQKKSKNNETL